MLTQDIWMAWPRRLDAIVAVRYLVPDLEKCPRYIPCLVSSARHLEFFGRGLFFICTFNICCRACVFHAQGPRMAWPRRLDAIAAVRYPVLAWSSWAQSPPHHELAASHLDQVTSHRLSQEQGACGKDVASSAAGTLRIQ